MKTTMKRAASLLLLLLPAIAFAQTTPDYTIQLKSGKFIPEKNAATVAKNADVFTKSLFNNKYYVVIQFTELPSQSAKDQLKTAGITLIDYLPGYAYTAAVDAGVNMATFKNNNIRSVFQLNNTQKTVPEILSNKAPAYAIKTGGYAEVDIVVYETIKADIIRPSLAALGATIIADIPSFRMFTIQVPQNKIAEIPSLPFVQWAEFIAPPNVPENLPGRTLHRVNILNDGFRNLKGEGMKIGVWDQIASQHLDFSPGRLINVSSGSAGSHGTHVSGTVGGGGIIDPKARGMAPKATIYSYSTSEDVQVAMATAVPDNTLISSNHSYHDGLGVQCGLSGASASYSLRARNTDINLNNFSYHLHCHSSGNSQSSCTGGWGTITGAGKAAKNNIVVGNITSSETLSSSSSCGPVHDGRVKPEIVAMGSSVFSTYTPLNTYNTISGTSMSTPGITGTVALLAQRYKQLNADALPPSTLIKNIACNTAHDLGNTGPDYRFGFGRINALAAVKILETNRYLLDKVATGGANDVTITIPAGASRLRVMLTWNDPAAAANSATALVNNLDLRVTQGANTYMPWILDPVNPSAAATTGDDNYSNIEQVTVLNPPAGTYTLRVNGEAITSGADQSYALTWDINEPYIEVIYPNGNEKFSPTESEVITWDNSGVTGTQTVQYSLDNGANWTTISSTVAASTTRLSWTVPNANTSAALIRVSSGSLSDASDANFTIIGKVANFTGSDASCNTGEVIFNWTATTNATHYDIYSLNPTSAEYDILASNVTGTTYTATGLTAGSSMWFTIRAKNNTTNAISERAVAINVNVSSGGNLGTPGTISGQTNVCGVGNNLMYSIVPVTGATSYTWTTPPGAVITSGQGSNSINVNFPPGSSSGNMTVTASNGTCQTGPSTLAITVGGTAVNAPVSGGDQSVTVCPGQMVPTLTATATVPAGQSVVWYHETSGGSVITDPSINSPGTDTYYAAARDNSSGCESTTRTAVTLTITQVREASITASGPVSFCQGGSVVLTATAGDSYSWNNGATTQSITVTTSGSYSVTVVTGPCSSTSPATTVTVNPLPTATITASGPLAFCDGGNVTLTASAGATYLWSNGATTQAITVTTSGSYSVTVRNASGCSATSTASVVTVSPSPVVTLAAAPYTKLYPGLTTTLTGTITPSGTNTYTWFLNGNPVTGATGSSLNVGLEGIGSYTVRATNTGGCSGTSPALVIGDSATTRLFIYPNPNKGQFQVAYYTVGATTNTITIYDSKGAYVFRKAYTINSPYQLMDVDLRKQGTGVYHIVLTDSKGKRVTKGSVVVQ